MYRTGWKSHWVGRDANYMPRAAELYNVRDIGWIVYSETEDPKKVTIEFWYTGLEPNRASKFKKGMKFMPKIEFYKLYHWGIGYKWAHLRDERKWTKLSYTDEA